MAKLPFYNPKKISNVGDSPAAKAKIAAPSLSKGEVIGVVTQPHEGADACDGNRFLRILAHSVAGKWEPIGTVPAPTLPLWEGNTHGAYVGSWWVFHVDSATVPHDDDATDAVPTSQAECEQSALVALASPTPMGVVQVLRRANAGKSKPAAFPSLVSGAATELSDEDYGIIDLCRRELIEQGLDAAPVGPVLIFLEERCIIGPLLLNQDGDGRWRAPARQYDIRTHRGFGAQKQQVKVDAQVIHFCLQSAPLPPATGKIDFSDDESVFAEAIRLVAGGEPDAPATRGRFDLFFDSDERLRVISGDGPLSGYRMWRFKATIDALRTELHRVESFREAVLASPLAKDSIEAARQDALQQAAKELVEVRQLVALEHEKTRSAERSRQALQNEIKQAEQCLLNLEKEVLQTREALSEAELDRVASIAARAAATVAERAVSVLAERIASPPVPVISARKVDLADDLPLPPPRVAPWAQAPVPATRSVLESLSVLKSGMRNAGFNDVTALPMLASWIAGLVPVVYADGEEESVLKAVVASLTGGRSVVVRVGNTVSFADLCGRAMPVQRVYAPHPDLLADAILTLGADEDKGFAIAAFSGADPSDATSLFAPVLSGWKDSESRLPLLHPSAVAQNDPYRQLSSACWPERLLPLIHFVEGVSPVPAPASFWRGASMITALMERPVSPTPVLPSLPPKDWAKMRSEVLRASEGTGDAKFRKAWQLLGGSADECDKHLYLCRLLPFALSCGKPAPSRPANVSDREVEAVRSRMAS